MPFINIFKHQDYTLVDNTSPFQLWASVYNREFIKNNNIHFSPTYYGEDLEFVVKVSSCNPNRLYLNNVFYAYQLREGSAVTTRFTPEKLEKFYTNIVDSYFNLKEWSANYQAFQISYI